MIKTAAWNEDQAVNICISTKQRGKGTSSFEECFLILIDTVEFEDGH